VSGSLNAPAVENGTRRAEIHTINNKTLIGRDFEKMRCVVFFIDRSPSLMYLLSHELIFASAQKNRAYQRFLESFGSPAVFNQIRSVDFRPPLTVRLAVE
jgi:hypothetical protein